MGCLFALVSAFSARLALFLVWVFTDRLTIAFSSGWEGIIGFIFLPYTTLFYALVYAPAQGGRRLRLGDRRPRDRARPVVAPVRLARCETSPGPARPAGAGGVARAQRRSVGLRRIAGAGPARARTTVRSVPTAASLCQPATPIMAALSVAMAGGGMRRRVPYSSAKAWARCRSIGLAATPPTMARAGSAELLEGAAELGDSTSMQAATNDAATSSTTKEGSDRT